MDAKTERRIKELEGKISHLRHTLQEIFPIWNMFDRKRAHLSSQLKQLDDERIKLVDGQMEFDELF